jgi:hypothetical protein
MRLTDALAIRPVLKRLDNLTTQLARLADAYEQDLAQRDIYVRPPQAGGRRKGGHNANWICRVFRPQAGGDWSGCLRRTVAHED